MVAGDLFTLSPQRQLRFLEFKSWRIFSMYHRSQYSIPWQKKDWFNKIGNRTNQRPPIPGITIKSGRTMICRGCIY